jgi:predicted molibdopterin-dependent oxidoreductase YjgC
MMASTGSGAMTHAMENVKKADLILLVGADVYHDNLIFSNMMREAMRFNDAKIIVVDPRRTKWEEWANLWLRPLPGTDIAWINGLIRLLIEKGVTSKEFVDSKTEGFETLRPSLEKFSPDFVQKATGISPQDLEALARLYASARKRAIVFGSGVTQHLSGVETVKALCNLALLTGETEEEGGGVYRYLPKCAGAFDMGSFSEFLPGHAPIEDDKERRRFEESWEKEIPAKPGLTYQEIFDGILEGKIKALYIFGEDPVITLPNLERIKNGLHQLEFLVVQDSFMTHVGSYAHVLLPGVTLPKRTFTSMERRIQRVRQAIEPMGEVKPDWKVLRDLSTRMGYPMAYQNPSEVMDEIASLVPFYARATYSNLEEGGIQWPLMNRKKRRFFPVEIQAPVEEPNETYPLWIIPGGFHFHYGIGTTVKRAKGLAKVYPESSLKIHPEDAVQAGIKDGNWIRVISPRGEVETLCRISEDIPRGIAYLMTFFFPVFVNNLLVSNQNPESHNLEYKMIVGRVEKR